MFGQAKELEKVSLQLHWKYQFQFAGFIMAKEKGYYEDVGLDVELKEYSIGINIEDEVLNHRANYGIYSSSILLSYLYEKPIVLMASFFKRSAMVILTKPEIKSPKDLIGKTIMADSKKYFDLKFKHMFNSLGIDTNDLILMKHTYNVDDFAHNRVDAITSFISDQPYKLDKLGIKYNILNPGDYGVYSLMLELFTSSTEEKVHFQRTQKFKEASIKGWKYALNNIDETVAVIHEKYTPGIAKDVLLNEAHKINKLILPYAYEIGSINENYLMKQARLFTNDYNLKEFSSLDSFIFDKKNKVSYMLLWKILAVSLLVFLLGLFFVMILKRNNRRLNELLDSTIEGVLIFENDICITSNHTTIDILDYGNINEIKGQHMLDFVSVESKEVFKEKMKSTSILYETVMKKKNGTLFPSLVKSVNLSDGKTQILTIMDLTKIKQTEEENLYLAERIKLAFNGSRDGLWDLNLIDNSVYFSPRWKEMLGYDDDELENTFDNWQSRIHPDDIEDVLKDVALSIDDKNHIFENKHRLRHKEGHWVWVYDRGKVQRDKEGKAIRMIGTHTDLSVEINLSNELSTLNENLEIQIKEQVEELAHQHMFILQQSKFASMGEMISIIAHQWRQPLNSINSNVAVMSSVLSKETIDQKILQKQMERIENNTQYMSNTIEDFSNFFRPNKARNEFILQDIAKSTLTLLGLRINDKEITIRGDKEVELFSFKEEYQQVVMIILNNAIDNFDSKNIEDPKIDMVISEDKYTTYFSICDNGGGIDKDKIDLIFDPYFTTKLSKEGVGLGLYIAKMLIEDSMQGQLEVKNIEDGICFKITVSKGDTGG